MGKFQNYDTSRQEHLWGRTDILDTDLEKLEFDKNFDVTEVYNSILDEEPTYHSIMNFPEEEQEQLYAFDEEMDQESGSYEDNDAFQDRNSYREIDRDDTYYLI